MTLPKKEFASVFVKIITHIDFEKMRFIQRVIEFRNHMNHFGMRKNSNNVNIDHVEKHFLQTKELFKDIYERRNEIISDEEALSKLMPDNNFSGGFINFSGCNIRPVKDESGTERVKPEPEPIKPLTHNAQVDLGLSVLWADCNVGAENPWERGARIAWGETTAKTYYSLYNYKHAKAFVDARKWKFSNKSTCYK